MLASVGARLQITGVYLLSHTIIKLSACKLVEKIVFGRLIMQLRNICIFRAVNVLARILQRAEILDAFNPLYLISILNLIFNLK